jgi:hypothetical protein
MHITHLRLCLVAAAALIGLPASATVSVFPGALCTSDKPFDKSLTGLMVNKVAGAGTTEFYCPIIHSRPLTSQSGTISISVNVRTGANNSFECFVRSVLIDNVTFDQVKLSFPSASAGTFYTISGAQLSMPTTVTTTAPASVNMRCLVPNSISNIEAGIASYRIEY